MIPRAKTITLTNDFHRTAINVRPLITGYLSPGQVARVDRKLCGIKGCTCARRNWGGYKIDFDHDGSAIVIGLTSEQVDKAKARALKLATGAA